MAWLLPEEPDLALSTSLSWRDGSRDDAWHTWAEAGPPHHAGGRHWSACPPQTPHRQAPAGAAPAAPSSARAGQASAPDPVSAKPGTTASDEARGRGGCQRPRGVQSHRGPWWAGDALGLGSQGSVHPDPPIPSGKGSPSEGKPPITPGTLCRGALWAQAQPPRAGSKPGGGCVPWEDG